jgi:thiol:disulfide interchange protein DsbD
MRTTTFAPIFLAIAACSAPRDTEAPPKSDAQVVEWAAIASAPKPGPENTVTVDLQVQLTVTGGWHVYSLTQTTGGPTAMTVKVAPPYEISGDISGPPPEKANDPNFGIMTETYSGEQIFRIPLKLASAESLNPPPIEVKIRSQACSDKLCLPARTTTLNVTPEKS